MIVKLIGEEVRVITEKICPQCGRVFFQEGRGRKVYCGEKCKRKHDNGEKTYLEKAREEEARKAKFSKLSIAEINKLAREAHMNYGQYVAVNHIS